MVDHHLVFAAGPFDVPQKLVDLAGEDVDPLDLYHVVGAANQGVDAGIGTAAGAVARQKAG